MSPNKNEEVWTFVESCLEPWIREQIQQELATHRMHLLTEDQLVQKRKDAYITDLKSIVEGARLKFKKAFELVFEYLSKQAGSQETKDIYEEIVEAGRRVHNHFIRDFDLSCFKGKKNLQEILGISSETLQKLYEIGCAVFEEKRLEEAGDLFFLLAMLNPSVSTYWLVLGVCFHRLEKYQEALARISHRGKEKKPRFMV